VGSKLALVLFEFGDSFGGGGVGHGAFLERLQISVDLAGDLGQVGVDGGDLLVPLAAHFGDPGGDDADRLLDEAGLLEGVEQRCGHLLFDLVGGQSFG
jgi:hypothetical protein